MGKKSSKIVDLFRAAGRLAYEWRDTLTYTGIAAATSVGLAMTGNNPSVLEGAFLASGTREAIRTLSWGNRVDLTYAGDFSEKKVNPDSFYGSAVVGLCYSATAFCGNLVNIFMDTNPNKTVAASLLTIGICSASIAATREAGGIRQVLKDYREMWNWHEDDGSGGQTGKLKRGFRDLKDGIIGSVPDWGMQKVPVPVRVPKNNGAGWNRWGRLDV